MTADPSAPIKEPLFKGDMQSIVNSSAWLAWLNSLNKPSSLPWVTPEMFNKSAGSGGDDTAAMQAANDSLEASGGYILFGPKTYVTSGLNLGVNVSIMGSGINNTRIKLKNGANANVVQTKNWATLTGSSSTGGSFRNFICNLTIDGNKSSNTTGSCLAIYGKASQLQDLSLESAFVNGLITEYGGADNFSTPSGTLEAFIKNLSIQQNGGSGWVHKGPHDAIIVGVVSFSNGGWGWEVLTPCNASKINTFLCTSGGIRVYSSGGKTGSINGTEIVGSTAMGWGMLAEVGGNIISAGSFGGPIGIELQANNNQIQGVVANTTTAGVKLNGVAACANLILDMFNNTGLWFDVANAGGKSFVSVWSSDTGNTGTLQNSAFSGTWNFSGPAFNQNQISGGLRVIDGKFYPPTTGYTAGNVGIFCDTQAPTSGQFFVGDRVFNSVPAIGQPKSWVCTVAGTPGTWVSEGNL